MSVNKKCNGNCRTCSVLGACPSDFIKCEDCGAELESGEELDIEVESIERGRYGSKIISVCRNCYEKFYQ